MSTQATPLQQTAFSLLKAFRTYFLLWVLPTILFTSAALIYSTIRQRSWQASQALVVRDEAAALDRQGRFDSIDSMQAFQETLLEVARSPIVVTGALKELGHPANVLASKQWPSANDVESLQDEISVSAPKGSQFGRTEVIYLMVKASSRQEAMRRTQVVCDQLEKHLGDLRSARAGSVIQELQDACSLAQKDQDAATDRLAEMESEVGSDLGELRVLNQSGSGDSNLRTALNQIKTEIRQVRAVYDAQQQQRELLERAQANPDALLGTPGRLLESQTALKRLKDGLVDAQLRTSDLSGRMSPGHPLVKAAIHAEEAVRQNLRGELATALQGIDADLRITRSHRDELTKQQKDLQSRLDGLAGMRAKYSVLVEDVQQRNNILEERKKKLAEARATENASQSASLITRFQEPQGSDDPIGPGNAVVIGAGFCGGLMTGVGFVFLVAPIGPSSRGRRLSDYLGFGRRNSDRTTSDGPAEASRVGRRSEGQVQTPCEDKAVHERRAEDQQTPNADRRERRN